MGCTCNFSVYPYTINRFNTHSKGRFYKYYNSGKVVNTIITYLYSAQLQLVLPLGRWCLKRYEAKLKTMKNLIYGPHNMQERARKGEL